MAEVIQSELQPYRSCATIACETYKKECRLECNDIFSIYNWKKVHNIVGYLNKYA